MANPSFGSGKASTEEHEDAFAALLARALRAPAPFYAARLRKAEVGAAHLSADVLARLPLTRREGVVRDQLQKLPHGTRRFADAGLPVRAGISGSGDDLLVLTWSAADLARERAAGTRLLGRIGLRPGTRVANTLPGALVTPGSLLLGDVVEELGGLDVPLGAIETDAAARQAWELVERVQPAVLVLEDDTASRFLGAAPPAERPWWRGIVWLQRGGEIVQPAALPEAIGFGGWQRRWLAVPEATSFVAHTCGEGRYHVDDGVIAEVVDAATGAPVAAGEAGTLVLTPLGLDALLLRYDTGIRARAETAACPCGGPGVTVGMENPRLPGEGRERW